LHNCSDIPWCVFWLSGSVASNSSINSS
jgi:hypothetical protein